MAEQSGMLSHVLTAVTNVNKEAEGTFLAKLLPGDYPIRDIAMPPLGNGLFMPQVDVGKKTMTWFEGNTGAIQVYLNTQISDDTTTTFDFGTTTIKSIVPNQIIQFKGEQVIVVSVDYDAGTCVVTRGFASTTPEASILTTDKGKILSTTGTPGDAAGRSRAALSDSYSNYLHRFEQVYSCDDLIQGTLGSYKDPALSIEYQIMDKFDMIAGELANSLWEGIATSASSANRTMNGLRAQVPAANITGSVGALYFSSIDTPVAASKALGANLDTMAVSPNMRIKLAVWNGMRRSGAVVLTDLNTAGGALDRFLTASGQELRVVTDSTLRDDEVFLFRAEYIGCELLPVLPPKPGAPGVVAPTGIRAELLARDGDADTVQVLAYASCQLRRPGTARLLTGVTSVDADGLA